MRVALCQFNSLVGAVFHNAARIKEFSVRAQEQGADLVIFPELAICGYPPRDLLFRKELHQQIEVALEEISRLSIPVVLGAPISSSQEEGQLCINAAVLCRQGTVEVVAKKQLLPNYNIFDERRYFEPGDVSYRNLFCLNGISFGVSICEDAWNEDSFDGNCKYSVRPIQNLVQQGADVILNLSASPFSVTKPFVREKLFSGIAKHYQRPCLMVGQVGANDQLIFDGHSMLIDAQGKIQARLNLFEEGLLLAQVEEKRNVTALSPRVFVSLPTKIELMRSALILGIKDYVNKCGAPGVLVGLSGGIDSAVVAALSVRALGKSRVIGVRMPSRFSSKHSWTDAQDLADNLGIRLLDVPIESVVDASRVILAPHLQGGLPSDLELMDQNLQARMRALVLMALSNANRFLVLSTGNKSELAMGYATLYGDMVGALAPLGDVYKTDVWNLARVLNQNDFCIPESSITKIPSAELKENQCDQDTLPPYDLLDQVLFQYIDCEKTVSQIATDISIAASEIQDIIRTVNANDYKRRQAAIILMVSDCVFGDGRRWPVAKQFDPFV